MTQSVKLRHIQGRGLQNINRDIEIDRGKEWQDMNGHMVRGSG